MRFFIIFIMLVITNACSNNLNDLKYRWKNYLIGDIKQGNESETKKYLEELTASTDELMNLAAINYNESGYVWEKYKDVLENSSHIVFTYRELAKVALSYKTPGTKHYNNKQTLDFLLTTLDWLNKNTYADGKKAFGNWYHWQIATPLELTEIMILLEDELTEKQISNYVAALDYHVKIDIDNPGNIVGANLADAGFIKILQALITDDKKLLEKTVSDLSTLYKHTFSGNGFYEDYSYLQHGNIAYTGSYGNVLLDKVSNGLYVLAGTKWDFINPMLYEWINKGIEPVIYKGFVMDNVKGRALSRNYDGYNRFGNEFIASLLKIYIISSGKNKMNLEKILGIWLSHNSDTFFIGNPGSVVNQEARKILDNGNLVTFDTIAKNFSFNFMERNVHRRPNYTFALARTSKRIAKNESINNENLKPWYQGDGRVSIYTDTLQYEGSYWPTVDPYRLAGVTRVVRPRHETTSKIIQVNGKSKRVFDYPREDISLNAHSGSVSLFEYGTASMSISNTNESLFGYKSWYMFDDEIVFVTTDITDVSTNRVETTLENRRLLLDTNLLMVNNIVTNSYKGKAKTVYIQDTLLDTSIAYYFPKEVQIDFYRTNTTGSWNDINPYINKTKKTLTDSYAILNYDHGVRPRNSSLIYYLLPNVSPEQLESYDNPMDIVVKDGIHSVYHKNLKILGVNFFKAGELGEIAVNQPLTYMQKIVSPNTYEVAFSDPIFGDSMLVLSIKGVESVKASDGVKSVLQDGKLTIVVEAPRKSKIYKFSYTI